MAMSNIDADEVNLDSSMELDESSQEPLRADNFEEIYNSLVQDEPDLEEEAHGSYSWVVKGFSKLVDKTYSSVFMTGDSAWRLVLFPKGCNQTEYASVFLEYLPRCKVDAIKREQEEISEGKEVSIDPELVTDETYSCCAQFALSLSNVRNPAVMQINTSHHRFRSEVKDWGFTRFADLRKIGVPASDFPVPFLEDDQLCISVTVRVLKDPTGVLWHSFVNYNSKKETGYVGLNNQGATCYMNSLLQSLFFTNVFRKTVYKIPTDADDAKGSVAYALQRVFYNLEKQREAVSTNELTRSFGWNSFDSFMQHDVQEFNRVLQDNLEKKMKGTDVENALNDIFVGKMKSYVKCIDVNYESARVEDFWDIQLNVKGMATLEDSFRDAIQVETLTGDNKYYAEGHGLQDAHKGIVFESFPNVLQLQLKRFDYDMVRDMMVKINDRHEFPLEIDLEPYLSDTADKSESHVYSLHGVLVHGGDLHGGHYYALIKPGKDSGWFKFDDDRVTRATLKEVQDDNFGGESLNKPKGYTGNPFKRFMNAYMLVYFRKSRLDKILSPVTSEDVPYHVRVSLDEEHRIMEKKLQEREEQYYYRKVRLLNIDGFRNHHDYDMADFSKATKENDDNLFETKIKRNATFLDLYNQVASTLKRDSTSIRLWMMTNRQNRTVRVDLPLDKKGLLVDQICDMHIRKDADMRIYVEYIDENLKSSSVVADDTSAFIFLKYFDYQKQTISGVMSLHVDRESPISVLSTTVCETMRWPEDTPITYYEEIKTGMVDILDASSSFLKSEIQDGDIICFERNEDRSEVAHRQFGSALDIYDFLAHRLSVTFEPRNGEDSDGTFDLELTTHTTYNEMAQAVGKVLDADPGYLQFTLAHLPSKTPRTVIRNPSKFTLQNAIPYAYANDQHVVIFYEILDLSLSELEHKQLVQVHFISDGITKTTKYEFYVNKEGFIKDILQQVAGKAGLDQEKSKNLRLYEVYNHRILKAHNPSDSLFDLNEFATIYVEVTSDEEEVELSEQNGVSIIVQHFNRDLSRLHGIPFYFTLLPDEDLSTLKKRLQKRLGFKDAQFAKVKLAVLQAQSFGKPYYLTDDSEVLYGEFEPESHILGLDHPAPSSSGHGMDQAIRMK
ncbi:ubiquitin carboxy terminal hydrolase Ubp21 [Schizosaccharomyces cryophilus OY26]|uniref:ubiquitinyl hydrolase 1 n=1 Tax=Schizosaccharomyces cryophilus (strain OY26 / ATCC MYA-4695 / CBS 11777 / NBRC 106824 / NRRL Y48691) TaxID=653667 RepID=S9XKN0_SCHCR|nr:ubiquitin carboxy terminal hydrolase Ubp21 [Schizosaccharomyces cryophilus OY26]EPY54271.1 ubiquitin carboxy terminal hydrolase Ubp21 [Schizosaccharomyces cryophilus OY26]